MSLNFVRRRITSIGSCTHWNRMKIEWKLKLNLKMLINILALMRNCSFCCTAAPPLAIAFLDSFVASRNANCMPPLRQHHLCSCAQSYLVHHARSCMSPMTNIKFHKMDYNELHNQESGNCGSASMVSNSRCNHWSSIDGCSPFCMFSSRNIYY